MQCVNYSGTLQFVDNATLFFLFLHSQHPSSAVIESQLRTVPPYLVSCVFSLFVSYVSYRVKQRCLPIASALLISIIGYAIAISTTHPQARYDSQVVMGQMFDLLIVITIVMQLVFFPSLEGLQPDLWWG